MDQSVSPDRIFGCSNKQNELCIVTFLRTNETISKDFQEFCTELYSFFCCELLVFCDKSRSISISGCPSKMITLSGTKYKRLLDVPLHTNASWILCVDNDISCNRKAIIQFLSKTFQSSCDAAWGRIDAAPEDSLVAKLVMIDKWLSHGVLRPLLWKCGLGITLPGQLCLFRRNVLKSSPHIPDTYLDDLAFGLSLRVKGANIIATSDILGLENPNNTFRGLWKQRERWADGFATVFDSSKPGRERLLVIIHGIAYHGLWIPGWSVIAFLATVIPSLSLLMVMLLSCMLAKGHISNIPAACCYQLIFPTLHLHWFFFMLRRLWNKKKKFEFSQE